MPTNNSDAHRYDDIINLPHHVSDKRPHMSMINRAAQFASFAALTGFSAAITETGRLTDEKVELDEYEKETLNEKLRAIAGQLDEHPIVAFTYFLPDEKKSGGSYVTVADCVKKIDEYERLIILKSGMKIPIDDISAITEFAHDDMEFQERSRPR